MHGSSATGGDKRDLSAKPDIRLGPVLVQPSLHRVTGVGGSATLEPQVMRVLLALIDADGTVVSRKALYEHCWPNVMVSEAALNRAIAEIRRIARTAGGEAFVIETLPRTGYRLVVKADEVRVGVSQSPGEALQPPVKTVMSEVFTRRLLLGGGAVLAVGSGVIWWRREATRSAEVAELVARGERMIREYEFGSVETAIAMLEKATQMAPDDGHAWGLLARAWSLTTEGMDEQNLSAAVEGTHAAARRALAITPQQPDAMLALALLAPTYADWLNTDQSLQTIVAQHPDHAAALSSYGMLLMMVGRVAEADGFAERAMALQPTSPTYARQHALNLWSTGHIDKADHIIQQAQRLWPTNPMLALAKFQTLAFTGRTASALAVVEDSSDRGMRLSPRARERFRRALVAIDSQAPHDIIAALDDLRLMATLGSFHATNTYLLMAAMGRLDDAYDVLHAYLLRRGPLASEQRADALSSFNMRRRKTMMLWCPAAAPIRADRRFQPLCEAIGLVTYWRRTGTVPDNRLARAIEI